MYLFIQVCCHRHDNGRFAEEMAVLGLAVQTPVLVSLVTTPVRTLNCIAKSTLVL